MADIGKIEFGPEVKREFDALETLHKHARIEARDDARFLYEQAEAELAKLREAFLDVFRVVYNAQYLGFEYPESEHVNDCMKLAHKYEPLARSCGSVEQGSASQGDQ